MDEKTAICPKCHWRIIEKGGFFKRKTPKGPCDRCLGQMTTFQIVLEKTIWLQHIPPIVEVQRPTINKNNTELPKP